MLSLRSYPTKHDGGAFVIFLLCLLSSIQQILPVSLIISGNLTPVDYNEALVHDRSQTTLLYQPLNNDDIKNDSFTLDFDSPTVQADGLVSLTGIIGAPLLSDCVTLNVRINNIVELEDLRGNFSLTIGGINQPDLLTGCSSETASIPTPMECSSPPFTLQGPIYAHIGFQLETIPPNDSKTFVITTTYTLCDIDESYQQQINLEWTPMDRFFRGVSDYVIPIPQTSLSSLSNYQYQPPLFFYTIKQQNIPAITIPRHLYRLRFYQPLFTPHQSLALGESIDINQYSHLSLTLSLDKFLYKFIYGNGNTDSLWEHMNRRNDSIWDQQHYKPGSNYMPTSSSSSSSYQPYCLFNLHHRIPVIFDHHDNNSNNTSTTNHTNKNFSVNGSEFTKLAFNEANQITLNLGFHLFHNNMHDILAAHTFSLICYDFYVQPLFKRDVTLPLQAQSEESDGPERELMYNPMLPFRVTANYTFVPKSTLNNDVSPINENVIIGHKISHINVDSTNMSSNDHNIDQKSDNNQPNVENNYNPTTITTTAIVPLLQFHSSSQLNYHPFESFLHDLHQPRLNVCQSYSGARKQPLFLRCIIYRPMTIFNNAPKFGIKITLSNILPSMFDLRDTHLELSQLQPKFIPPYIGDDWTSPWYNESTLNENEPSIQTIDNNTILSYQIPLIRGEKSITPYNPTEPLILTFLLDQTYGAWDDSTGITEEIGIGIDFPLVHPISHMTNNLPHIINNTYTPHIPYFNYRHKIFDEKLNPLILYGEQLFHNHPSLIKITQSAVHFTLTVNPKVVKPQNVVELTQIYLWVPNRSFQWRIVHDFSFDTNDNTNYQPICTLSKERYYKTIHINHISFYNFESQIFPDPNNLIELDYSHFKRLNDYGDYEILFDLMKIDLIFTLGLADVKRVDVECSIYPRFNPHYHDIFAFHPYKHLVKDASYTRKTQLALRFKSNLIFPEEKEEPAQYDEIYIHHVDVNWDIARVFHTLPAQTDQSPFINQFEFMKISLILIGTMLVIYILISVCISVPFIAKIFNSTLQFCCLVRLLCSNPRFDPRAVNERYYRAQRGDKLRRQYEKSIKKDIPHEDNKMTTDTLPKSNTSLSNNNRWASNIVGDDDYEHLRSRKSLY